MSTYAIGDIQGCFDELQQLLALIKFDPANDTLWFAGDLVNRGPRNLETMETIMAIPDVKVVLGNHDLHFLAVANGSHPASKSDTIDDILNSDRLDDITHWLRQQSLILHDTEFDCTLVHAGIPPNWTIDDAITYATEVEVVLKSEHYGDFFDRMYGNLPAIWADDLRGYDRLRTITNYLTRLRYCKHDGEMELTHKANIQPAGYSPWFTFPRQDNRPILFGHWAALEGITHRKNMIALDTGCVWGRTLSAYRLNDQQFYSVPASTNI